LISLLVTYTNAIEDGHNDFRNPTILLYEFLPFITQILQLGKLNFSIRDQQFIFAINIQQRRLSFEKREYPIQKLRMHLIFICQNK